MEIKDDAEKTLAGRRTSITSENFASLAKQLGRRLGFEAADVDESWKDAALAYLISGRLEGVVNVWIDKMQKEDNPRQSYWKRNALSSAQAHLCRHS